MSEEKLFVSNLLTKQNVIASAAMARGQIKSTSSCAHTTLLRAFSTMLMVTPSRAAYVHASSPAIWPDVFIAWAKESWRNTAERGILNESKFFRSFPSQRSDKLGLQSRKRPSTPPMYTASCPKHNSILHCYVPCSLHCGSLSSGTAAKSILRNALKP